MVLRRVGIPVHLHFTQCRGFPHDQWTFQQGKTSLIVFISVETIVQFLNRQLSGLLRRIENGGQGRIRMERKIDIIKPDDGNVIRYCQPKSSDRVQRPNRDHVIERHNRCWTFAGRKI